MLASPYKSTPFCRDRNWDGVSATLFFTIKYMSYARFIVGQIILQELMFNQINKGYNFSNGIFRDNQNKLKQFLNIDFIFFLVE